MVEFFKKNQKNITMGAAVALLLVCYFQQKELSKLRKEVHSVKEITTNQKTVDSLVNELKLK